MSLNQFNSEAATSRYSYRESPVQQGAFLIVRQGEDDEVPVGDYTVLDSAEDPQLSEKKVMNIVSLLNGRKRLIQLGHETNARVLYHIVSEGDEEDSRMQVVFYHLGQEGVSVENALLRIERNEHVA